MSVQGMASMEADPKSVATTIRAVRGTWPSLSTPGPTVNTGQCARRKISSATDPIRKRRSPVRSEEHTSELQSHVNLVCRLLLEKKKKKQKTRTYTNTQ